MSTECELTEAELNAVTGGVMYEGQCTPCHGHSQLPGGPPSAPANAAAMAAWNNLLTQYGF
jgi:bacteriocin-like protein